jgi:hypothetical protein
MEIEQPKGTKSIVSMDSSFADELRAKSAAKKSEPKPANGLLAMLGKSALLQAAAPPAKKSKRAAKPESVVDAADAKLKDWQRELIGDDGHTFKHKTKRGDSDTSSDDDDDNEEMEKEEEEKGEPATVASSSLFFPLPNDADILRQAGNFSRTQSQATMVVQWKANRDKAVKSFKRSRKVAMYKKNLQLRENMRSADNRKRL